MIARLPCGAKLFRLLVIFASSNRLPAFHLWWLNPGPLPFRRPSGVRRPCPRRSTPLLLAKTPAGSGINNITAALPTSVLLQPSSMFRFPGLWVASFARITVFSSRIWHFVQQIGVLFVCLKFAPFLFEL